MTTNNKTLEFPIPTLNTTTNNNKTSTKNTSLNMETLNNKTALGFPTLNLNRTQQFGLKTTMTTIIPQKQSPISILNNSKPSAPVVNWCHYQNAPRGLVVGLDKDGPFNWWLVKQQGYQYAYMGATLGRKHV